MEQTTGMKLGAFGYTLAYEFKANPKESANGIVELSKEGAPKILCLANGFTTTPSYKIPAENFFDCGICAAIETDEGFVLAGEQGTRFEVLKQTETSAELRIFFKNGALARETVTVSEDGIQLKVVREKNPLLREDGNDIAILVPALLFDGKDYSEVALHDKDATITYGDYKVVYETGKALVDTCITLCNRDGHYRMFMTAGAKNVQVKIRIEKA